MDASKKLDEINDGAGTTTPSNAATGATNAPDDGTKKEEKDNGSKALSFDEMLATNKAYQAEFDRRVQKAIETRAKNLDKQTAPDKKTTEANSANGGADGKAPEATAGAEADEVTKLKEALMGYKLKESLTEALKGKGVAEDKTPFIERLIDKADVFDGDEVSGEALDKQINDILKAFPYFNEKKKEDGKQAAGFKVGGPGEDDITVTDSLREQIRKNFGLK